MRIFTAVVVVALACSAYVQPARACSCGSFVVDVAAPADGARDVPRNTRLWITPAIEDEDVLRDEAGAVVPTRRTVVESQGRLVAVHTPLTPLVAGARYRIVREDLAPTEFTVGDDFDVEPPAPPRVELVSTASSLFHACMGAVGPGESAVHLSVRHDGVLAVVAAGDGLVFDFDAVHGEVPAMTAEEDDVVLGDGSCSSGWRGAGPLVSGTVHAGTFDLAGNFSGFDAGTRVTFPPPGCSCRAAPPVRAPTRAAPAVVVVVVAVATMRRRRQR